MPVAREIFQEGLVIPPVRLLRRGRVAPDVLALLLANVRTPEEREGDLAAQVAANRVGQARLIDLVRGTAGVRPSRRPRHCSDYTERAVRATIRAIPDGRYTFEDVLDDDGVGAGPVTIRAAVDIRDDRAVVDFTGTDSAGARAASTPTTPSRCRPASTSSVVWCAMTCSTTRACRGR